MSATPASMLQVVSTGLQDRERLNVPQGQPSLQFYRSVMRKRTRWASQWRRVEFDNLADFGRTAIATLPINGELITRATLVVDLPDIYSAQQAALSSVGPRWAWTNSIGHALVATVDFLIDGAIIDTLDSQHLEVIDELSRPVEHFDSTDALIARDPSSFTDQQTFKLKPPQTNPQSVEIVVPFWWNRGPGPKALPIQALWKDKVQIRVTFRPVQQCVYTSARINAANPLLSTNQGTGPLPNIAGCGFFVKNPAGVPIYDAGSTENLAALGLTNPFLGIVLPDKQMPTEYHFTDAYWIVEYVSLEDREAVAFRMADLEIPIVQHVPLPLVITGGSPRVRIRMGQGGLVRDLTWVAQRVEAPSYNAHFLFSRDLAPTGFAAPTSPCDVPWWPNAQIPNWDFGTGYIRPGFSDRGSDPISAASMTIRGLTRFEHEGPSIFRSLIPVLGSARAPLIDRYIYRYDFGFWTSGGLAEALYRPTDEIRGCANWDKLPRRELDLTMNQSGCGGFSWVTDTSQPVQTITGSSLVNIDDLFAPTTDGLFVTLEGAHPIMSNGSPDPLGNNGDGATVAGYIDMTALRRQAGYIHLYGRTNEQGSASIVQQLTSGYQWIAVAGSGGRGIIGSGGGGVAGDAVEIGWQGGNGSRTHNIVSTTVGGNIIYNSISSKVNLVSTDASFNSTNTTYQMLTAGTFTSVQFYYSITNNTETAAYIEVKLHNQTTATSYTLTSPTATTFQPIASHISRSLTPIPVSTGDILYFTIRLIPRPGEMGDPLPFVAYTTVAGDSTTLASRLTITQLPGQIVIPRTFYGGGGGGRLTQAGVGLSDGIRMPTSASFVQSHQQTGGTTFNFSGGDGYYGGGSGSLGGGGGGSFVSSLITQVETRENPDSDTVRITIVPQRRVPTVQPSFNIYAWITRYNRLRINSGRGVLMFSETA